MNSLISDEIYETVQNAKNYESIGRYNEAAEILSKFWKNINEPPDVSELNDEEKAEILMRCGSIASHIGSCQQKKNVQKLARKLLSMARDLFSICGNVESVAGCATYLALTYLRMGKLDEARSWINNAFMYNLDESSEVKLYVYIVEGMILFREEKYPELVNKCKMLESLFRSSPFYVLQGNFNNNYAYGLMKLGDKDGAVKRFRLAKHFYNQTKHYLFLALLDNNLAVFYKDEKRFLEAHRYAKSARANFKKQGDKTREGYSIDTQAQIYMAEGKYEEALKCANEAIRMLENGENYCYLANSMRTKSHIQLYLKDYGNSLETERASVNIAFLHVSKSHADKFTEEYVGLLKRCGLE